MASYGELRHVNRGAPTIHSPAGGADRGGWAGGGSSLYGTKKCFVCDGSPVLSAGVCLAPVWGVFLARTREDKSGFGGRCDIACRRPKQACGLSVVFCGRYGGLTRCNAVMRGLDHFRRRSEYLPQELSLSSSMLSRRPSRGELRFLGRDKLNSR